MQSQSPGDRTEPITGDAAITGDATITGDAAHGDGFGMTFVDRADEVADALSLVDAPAVGVDVERADAHHYFRRAALIQVGVADHCVLLDAVALAAFPDLDAFFDRQRLAVLHAMENDLEPLSGRGVALPHLADTSIAAAVLGLPTGLGPLLEHVLDVQLDSDKGAFQRADWEQRPLTPGMASYAASDVVHLPRLWDALRDRLRRAGRERWYAEELSATIERAGEQRRAWTRVKGVGRLSGRDRAVLRALWERREEIAREYDIAPNRLLHDDVLRDLATSPPNTEAQLVRRSPRRRGLLRQHAGRLMEAVVAGQDAAPEERETNGRRWSDTDRTVYDALRRCRSTLAEELGIDAGVLCPSRPLWGAVMAGPADGVELCRAAELRAWQTELLAEPLWAAYVEARQNGEEASSQATTA